MTAEQIVERLASLPAPTDGETDTCALCGVDPWRQPDVQRRNKEVPPLSEDYDGLSKFYDQVIARDPSWHDATCPWRQAREATETPT